MILSWFLYCSARSVSTGKMVLLVTSFLIKSPWEWGFCTADWGEAREGINQWVGINLERPLTVNSSKEFSGICIFLKHVVVAKAWREGGNRRKKDRSSQWKKWNQERNISGQEKSNAQSGWERKWHLKAKECYRSVIICKWTKEPCLGPRPFLNKKTKTEKNKQIKQTFSTDIICVDPTEDKSSFNVL